MVRTIVRCSTLPGLLLLGACQESAMGGSPGDASRALPYDRSSPIVYVNDEAVDVYTDEYLMALASVGDIDLRALITHTSIAPYNRWVTREDAERMALERIQGIEHARSSGFRNLPAVLEAEPAHLEAPASGRIEDTTPLGTAASRLIVEEARMATPHRPLLLIMGGPLTLAADAYLLDPSVADRMVVAWQAGNGKYLGPYNGWADAWAVFIALERLRLVTFENRNEPEVPKQRLAEELPPTDLREWMVAKLLPVNGLPNGRDGDALPAVVLMEPDVVRAVERIGFDRWQRHDGHEVPAVRTRADGRALLVTETDQDLATREWWRALANRAAYGNR